jgi:hypothetical protein
MANRHSGFFSRYDSNGEDITQEKTNKRLIHLIAVANTLTSLRSSQNHDSTGELNDAVATIGPGKARLRRRRR